MKPKTSAPKYSRASLASARAQPGAEILSSTSLGWNSLLLQVVESPAFMEPFEKLPTPDHQIIVVQKGVFDIESATARSIGKSRYFPGRGGMNAPMTTTRLRWSSTSHTTLETLHLYLPQPYLELAAEENRRPGQASRVSFPDVLGFDDPLITALLCSLAEQVRQDAPDLYADVAAHFLASHLLLKARPVASSNVQSEAPVLGDRRLQRVLEYMRSHFAEPLTVQQLAKEAAISPFHFARLFKARMRRSPAQYLVELRLAQAKQLLKETDLPVAAIALSVGYTHGGNFAAAFSQRFGRTPRTFRREDK